MNSWIPRTKIRSVAVVPRADSTRTKSLGYIHLFVTFQKGLCVHVDNAFQMSSGTTDVKYSEPRQPLYEASTQFQNWRFSQEGLTQIREKLNETAVAAIRNTFEVDEVKEKHFAL